MPAVCKEPTYHLRGNVGQWFFGSGFLEIRGWVLELPAGRDGVVGLTQSKGRS